MHNVHTGISVWKCKLSCHFVFKSDHLPCTLFGLISATCFIHETPEENERKEKIRCRNKGRNNRIQYLKWGDWGKEKAIGGEALDRKCVVEPLQQQLSWGTSGLCSNLSLWALLHWGVVWSYNHNTTETTAFIGHACEKTNPCPYTQKYNACIHPGWRKCWDLLNK